jgi:hypothetical protein
MFLHHLPQPFREPTFWYGKDDQAKAKGWFLVLFSDKDDNLTAKAVYAQLGQLGQFMMGTGRFGGGSITLSGSYGNDGLPRTWEDLSPRQQALLTTVPADLAKEYWQGGGWNSTGREAPAMNAWAVKNLHDLTRRR